MDNMLLGFNALRIYRLTFHLVKKTRQVFVLIPTAFLLVYRRLCFLMVTNGNLCGFEVGLSFIVLPLQSFPMSLALDAFSIQVDISTSTEPPAS